ncbi:hypothetical protein IMCC14465_04960 [alpha proteobacterium IMCC14465]|uniref:Polysaccharide biosynthesis protein CapD-like domain-containing protein n=1 Tax=alpha proteobacterium IMCC14465 TaxID=1220535 RepID=J9DYM7_9PROT|nr:hypothetical protein IMCC14465_04960 [alpha proteobacterium IMCC14465]
MTSYDDLFKGSRNFLEPDLNDLNGEMRRALKGSRCLVVGAGGSIGRSVAKLLFGFEVSSLTAVDLSENGLVELVRDIRSSFDYDIEKFETLALDCGSSIFLQFLRERSFDYVLNLSALKHVRSESSVFTMKRMCQVNIFNSLAILDGLGACTKKYFCVSTDKSSAPANFMGATKKAMELCLFSDKSSIPISSARFANVIFSDGSLFAGVKQRVEKKQPVSAPKDIWRYFITEQEAGFICLISLLFGETGEVLFPRGGGEVELENISELVKAYLAFRRLNFQIFDSEFEARQFARLGNDSIPLHFFASSTTGEKTAEEFFSSNERFGDARFKTLSAVINKETVSRQERDLFLQSLDSLIQNHETSASQLIGLFKGFIPSFNHIDTGVFLDSKM